MERLWIDLDKGGGPEDRRVDSILRPGRISSIAASTPRVTSRVLAQGSFSTISIRPGPSLMTASPKSGQVSHTTSPTSPRRSGVPSGFLRSLMGTWARSSGAKIGKAVRIPIR
jgi:hypothetical protein